MLTIHISTKFLWIITFCVVFLGSTLRKSWMFREHISMIHPLWCCTWGDRKWPNWLIRSLLGSVTGYYSTLLVCWVHSYLGNQGRGPLTTGEHRLGTRVIGWGQCCTFKEPPHVATSTQECTNLLLNLKMETFIKKKTFTMYKLLTLVSSHASHSVNTIWHDYSNKGLYWKTVRWS